MKAVDFLSLYSSDSLVQNLVEGTRTSKAKAIRLKGLSGSLDAVLLASLFGRMRTSHLVILQDKEEAAYFSNDLQNLLERKEVFLFPMSYKRPYEYEETENANVLMRAEALTHLTAHPDSQIIVTYPEALSEKVITKKSLAANTFSVKVKEKLDRAFLEEFLHSYDFEKTDFVYEAGQFAVRGGIIDVFSFANEIPYRIELFGDEVDSIRTFDPGSQLSVDTLDQVSLMPNVQARLVQEDRQSLLKFMSASTHVWIKDTQLTADIIGTCFDKASAGFDRIVRESGNAKLMLKPEHLFVSSSL
ncbi:MAG: transcription-repair coupling factor, partial [Cyclobacteriaceae bacterium]|nr:transcription-repair coupling factor [Cyclobacteriaceae bacterium]